MDMLNVLKSNMYVQLLLAAIIIYFVYNYHYSEKLENLPMDHQGPVDFRLNATPQLNQNIPLPTTAPQLSSQDLLPKYDDANEFSRNNPAEKVLQEQNFLQNGYHIGISTEIESGTKIPYYDLRDLPVIPKNNSVSPWMQSSFEQSPGMKRRGFTLNA